MRSGISQKSSFSSCRYIFFKFFFCKILDFPLFFQRFRLVLLIKNGEKTGNSHFSRCQIRSKLATNPKISHVKALEILYFMRLQTLKKSHFYSHVSPQKGMAIWLNLTEKHTSLLNAQKSISKKKEATSWFWPVNLKKQLESICDSFISN